MTEFEIYYFLFADRATKTSAIASLLFSYSSYLVVHAQQRLARKLAKITSMRRLLSLEPL